MKITPEMEASGPMTWPQLVMCADEGSDGVAAFNWLVQTQRFNGEFLSDPAHGMANDLKLSLQRVGLWKHTLLMTAMLNVPHGPWSEQRFFQKLSEAHLEYLASANAASCPLFNHYYPAMLKDRGLEGELGSEDLPERVWQMFRDSWCMWTRGAKVGASRWFAVEDAAQAFDTEWHSKLLSISYMMWEDGELQSLVWNKKVLAPSASAESEGVEVRRSMVAAQRDVQLSRQACKNGLEFTYMVLTQTEMQYTQRIIETVGKELRKHHGHQSVAVRSVDESYVWLLDQASRGFWMHLLNIAKVLNDLGAQEYCGMENPSATAGSPIPDSHPLVQDQMRMAEKMGDLVVCVLKNRIVRWMPITCGWPSRSILFASNANVELKDKALSDLKDAYECYRKLGEEHGAFSRKVYERSTFQLLSTKQLVAILEKHDWKLEPPVVQWVEKKYRTTTINRDFV